jgi:hypothetical protein
VPAASKIAVPVDFDPKALNDSLRRAVEGLDTAQTAKTFAAMFGSKKQLADATENVNVVTFNLARTLKAEAGAILASSDSYVVKAQRLAVVKQVAEEARIKIKGLTDDSHDLGDTLSELGGAAASIARVGDAIGGIDRGVLDTIDNVGRLAGALGDLSKIKLSGKDGIFSSLTNVLKGIPKIGEALAAAINLGKSAFNAITGKETKDANDAILKENNAQLAKLRQDLNGFGSTVGDLLGDSRAIATSSILQARAGTSGAGRGFRDVEGLDKELRAAGSSVAELKRRAEELGITIVDAKGRISEQGLDALNKALLVTVANLTTFKNTLEDRQFIDDARREIFDATDAQSVAGDFLAQIRKFAPELADRLFSGADAATRDGRAALEQGLRDAFEAAVAGKIDPETIKAFGGIKPFVDFLLGADRALDQFADTAKQASGDMINVVKGFKDFNLERARFMATADDTRRTSIGNIPRPNPTPIPVGVGGTTASVGQVVFSPTIRIDGRDKDAIEITTEVLTEIRRRAKASANKQTRDLVTLLPS